MNYKLSPSDLTYLFDGCKFCFALKVKHGVSQPSIPLPGIFSAIGGLQKVYYSNKRTETFCPELPPGVVSYGEKWVKSKEFTFPSSSNTCYINGRFDIVIELDSHEYAIIDFKTARQSDEKGELYSKQLHAYALALENPATGALKLSPVKALGLLFFAPDTCAQTTIQRQRLEGPMQWMPIERDDARFMSFLETVVALLDGSMPEPSADCNWCNYRSRTRELNSSVIATSDHPPESTAGPSCPRCESQMKLRSGKNGNFWGCTKYPECRGTRNV